MPKPRVAAVLHNSPHPFSARARFDGWCNCVKPESNQRATGKMCTRSQRACCTMCTLNCVHLYMYYAHSLSRFRVQTSHKICYRSHLCEREKQVSKTQCLNRCLQHLLKGLLSFHRVLSSGYSNPISRSEKDLCWQGMLRTFYDRFQLRIDSDEDYFLSICHFSSQYSCHLSCSWRFLVVSKQDILFYVERRVLMCHIFTGNETESVRLPFELCCW